MADEFIQVMEKEDGELVEFPTEEDGTLLLRTIQTQYATAIGLRYKGPTGAWRAVKEGDNAELLAPKGGWGYTMYYVRFSDSNKEDSTLKRKSDETNDLSSSPKQMKAPLPLPSPLLRDLAVINIPVDAKHKALKSYLNEKYGGNPQLKLKTDEMTGQCRGYGFVRFDNEESAKKALESEDDEFMGEKISVKPKTLKPLRMYVNSLAEDTTKEDIVGYFSKYGEVSDSYIPTPFRQYAFFTFADGDVGRACLRDEHKLNGRRVNVKIRVEGGREEVEYSAQFGLGGGQGSFGRGRGGLRGRGGRGGSGRGRGVLSGGRGGSGRGQGVSSGGRGGSGGGGAGSRGSRGGRGGGRGARGGFGRGRGGGFQNPQEVAQFKNMLYRYLSATA